VPRRGNFLPRRGTLGCARRRDFSRHQREFSGSLRARAACALEAGLRPISGSLSTQEGGPSRLENPCRHPRRGEEGRFALLARLTAKLWGRLTGSSWYPGWCRHHPKPGFVRGISRRRLGKPPGFLLVRVKSARAYTTRRAARLATWTFSLDGALRALPRLRRFAAGRESRFAPCAASRFAPCAAGSSTSQTPNAAPATAYATSTPSSGSSPRAWEAGPGRQKNESFEEVFANSYSYESCLAATSACARRRTRFTNPTGGL
jgi:hypothetical protein